ncbi:MAG: succinate dehydrogenase assembly factor 2 [Caulobacterales bacterium]
MDDIRLKRLKLRAWRRGFREADLILGPFADSHAQSLTPGQFADLETLLEQPDQDVYAWIVGLAPIPPRFDTEVMQLIRSFRHFARTARGPDLGA